MDGAFGFAGAGDVVDVGEERVEGDGRFLGGDGRGRGDDGV